MEPVPRKVERKGKTKNDRDGSKVQKKAPGQKFESDVLAKISTHWLSGYEQL